MSTKCDHCSLNLSAIMPQTTQAMVAVIVHVNTTPPVVWGMWVVFGSPFLWTNLNSKGIDM